MNEQKKLIRNHIANIILNQTDTAAGLSLCELIQRLDAYKKADTVLSFLSMNDEIATDEITKTVLKSKKNLALPCITQQMDYYQLQKRASLENQIEIGRYGIREPKHTLAKLSLTDISNRCLVLVPGRAFTASGKRLGRGKGYYDKYFFPFFHELHDAKPYFAGVCYESQMMSDIPSEDHDIVMDCIVTERQIFLVK